MKKRLFVVLAVLALTVCLLPMVVGAEETEACTHPDGFRYVLMSQNRHREICKLNCGYSVTEGCGNDCVTDCKCGLRPATGHSEAPIDAVPVTCTTPGKTAGVRCTNANCPVGILVAQEDIPAPGHKTRIASRYNNRNEHKVVCDNPGCDYSVDVACTNDCLNPCVAGCNRPATGHDTEVMPAVPVTCTTPGKTEGLKCNNANCPLGGILVAQEDIPAPGHKTRIAQRYTNRDEHRVVCDNAGCDYDEDVACTNDCTNACACGRAATGHTEVILAAEIATCQKEGKTMGKMCSVCDEILLEQEPIDKLAHQYTIPATCEEPAKCGACREADPDQPALQHDIRIAQRSATRNEHLLVCDRAGCEYQEWVDCENDCTNACECGRAATGHDWDDGKVIKNATYDDTGLILYTCKNDSTHTKEEATAVLKMTYDPNLDVVPRTGNVFVEWLYALIAG